MKFEDLQEDGRIVKGVNTTADVGPNQTSIEANKLVGKVNKDGYPPELHSKARKNSKPNTLYNLGLAEQFLRDVYTPRKYLTQLEQACLEGGHELPENISHTGTATARKARKKKITPGDEEWFKHWFSLPHFMKESTGEHMFLKLVRTDDQDILQLRKKGETSWVEVRGKPNYEIAHDRSDRLHQLLDKLDPATVSKLMDGSEVYLNPKNSRTAPSIAIAHNILANEHVVMENPLLGRILGAIASRGYKVAKSTVQAWMKHAPPGVTPETAADAIIKAGTGIAGVAVHSKTKPKEPTNEKWSKKYKKSINCSNPKGFSQKAHCAGRKKTNEQQDWYDYYKQFRDSNDDVVPFMKKHGYDPYNRKDVSTFLNIHKDAYPDIAKTIATFPAWAATSFGANTAKSYGVDKGELKRALKIRKDFAKNMPDLYKALSTNPQDVNFEDVTPGELNALERVVDKAFAQVGIDVEFTRHFLDRANDSRNGEPITVQELARLFSKEIRRWGKPIAQMGPDTEAVMKDLESDINIPFVLRWNGKELEMIAKTVMRKKNFRTSNKEFPVENLEEWVCGKCYAEPCRCTNENFADGKKKGKSRPGRVKRAGASCKGSVSSLRAKAKKYSGERAKMYHWCANMKSGKKKK